MSLKKLFSGVIALALVAGALLPSTSSAATVADLQAQIQALMAQINSLSSGTTASASCSYVFTRNLQVGSVGTDVMNLQKVLNMSADTQVNVVGAGSPGMETSTFGPATKAAVIKFQNKYASQVLAPVGLTYGTGFVGAATRAKLNTVCSTPVVVIPSQPGTPVNTTAVSVALAIDNTPSRSIVLGQASAELAKFAFNGSGVITNVTLQQTGLSAYNNTLNNVYLYNGATRLTDSGSVSSNGVITFNSPSGLFSVNGSMTITVRADLVSGLNNNNQTGTVGVSLVGYSVSGVPATASVMGNMMTIVNVTAASATFNSAVTNPAANASVNAGTSNYTVWSNQINVSTRNINLKAATFRYVGSAPATSLQNIKFYVDGLQVGGVASVQAINGSSYMVFDLMSAPYVLTTGSHTLEVRADVVGGASYSFTVSIQNAADLMLEDSQLPGVFVTYSLTGGGSVTGNSVTIQQGTNSVTIDPNFITTTVTGGATNVPIASYKFTGYGEDVKITSLKITPSISGGVSALGSSLNNVTLYANGAQIGSTANYSGSGFLTFNLGSSLIVPSGQSVIVSVKADLIASTSVNQTSGNLSVALAGFASNAEGQSSHQVFAIPGSANTPTSVTSNTITIGGNSIVVAKNGALSNQSVAPNTANVKIGSYVIQAGSSEALQVTSLVVGLNASSSNGVTVTNISNLKVVGNGITANPLNPQTSNNFSTNFTIPVSGSQIVDVYGDVGATVGTASTTLVVTGRGIVSNVSTTTSAVIGQNVIIAQGAVAIPSLVSSATLSSQYQVGPSSPTIASYKFIATSSSATIQELRFVVTGPVNTLTLTAPGLAPISQTVITNGTTTFAGLNIMVPAGYDGVNISVTPTYNTIGDGINGFASNQVSTTTLGYVKSLSGNQTTEIYPSVATNGMTIVGSKPTLSIAVPVDQNNNPVKLSTGLTEIARIRVAADASGSINVQNLPFSVQSSGNATAIGVIGSSTSPMEVRNDTGGVITAATSSTLFVAAGGPGTATIYFTGAGYPIQAGSSEVFHIFTTTAPGSGTSGDNQLGTKLGVPSSFVWTDVKGNTPGLTGTLIPSAAYPVSSVSVTN